LLEQLSVVIKVLLLTSRVMRFDFPVMVSVPLNLFEPAYNVWMVLGSVGSAVNWLLLQYRVVSPLGNVGSEDKLLLEQLRVFNAVQP